jgi:rubrerythrin
MYLSDILILGIILGGFLFYNISKAWQSIRIKRMLANAKKAEKDAIYLLKQHGY